MPYGRNRTFRVGSVLVLLARNARKMESPAPGVDVNPITQQLQRRPRRRVVDDGVQPAQSREPPLLELPDKHRPFTIAHDVLSCRAL